MSFHFPLAASSAHQWRNCGGWAALAPLYPEPDTEESVEGEQAHEVASDAAEHAVIHGALTMWEPRTEATREMIEGAKLYAYEIGKTAREHRIFGGPDVFIERTLACPSIHPLNGGTPDFALYAQKALRLYIDDFKFGRMPVEVEGNSQLINYYAALRDKLQIDGSMDQHLTVRFRIVQPRANHRDGPVRTWTTTGAELRGEINQMAGAAAENFSPKAQLRAGPHCNNCPARLACPSGTAWALKEAGFADAPLPSPPTPEQLGDQLTIFRRAAETIRRRLAAIEEQAIAMGGVPGWSLDNPPGRMQWKLPPEQIIALLGEAVAKPEDAITPTQAIKAGISEEAVRGLSARPPGSAKLVPSSSTLMAKVVKNYVHR